MLIRIGSAIHYCSSNRVVEDINFYREFKIVLIQIDTNFVLFPQIFF